MDYQAITVEPCGAIEVVTLNRPEVLNALSPVMVGELLTYFGELEDRSEVRVVVLRAEGRAFCAGLDLKGWERPEGRTQGRHGMNTQIMIGNIYRRMRACPQPIIALGQGAAAGGGMSLLLAADVRYGTPTLRMNSAFIRMGFSGCDMGSSYFLPRMVGSSLAAEMLLTGRFIDAERAWRHGLISEIVDESALLETGLRLAAEMLENSPEGLRMTKKVLGLNIDAPSLDAAMALEDRQQILLSTCADQQEAVRAFLEKRKPVFSDN